MIYAVYSLETGDRIFHGRSENSALDFIVGNARPGLVLRSGRDFSDLPPTMTHDEYDIWVQKRRLLPKENDND